MANGWTLINKMIASVITQPFLKSINKHPSRSSDSSQQQTLACFFVGEPLTEEDDWVGVGRECHPETVVTQKRHLQSPVSAPGVVGVTADCKRGWPGGLSTP